MPLIQPPDLPAQPRFVGPILLALGLFLGLVTVVPLLWSMLPLKAGASLWWFYLALAAAGSIGVASRRASPGFRVSAAIAAGLAVAILLVAGVGAGRALDVMTQGFGVTTTDARAASPSGRLIATHEHFDDGALGASDSVVVSGRLLPGVVSWAYDVPIPDDAYPERLSWSGDRDLIVDGRTYSVPDIIERCSW
jgi:hypothetical protein